MRSSQSIQSENYAWTIPSRLGPLGILLLILSSTLLASPLEARNTPRLWSNSEGATFEAVLLWFDGTSVFLKEEKQGREFKVPLEKLSASDQKYLTAWQEDQKKAKIGFEFGLISESYRHKRLSKIEAEDEGRYIIDGDQKGDGELTYTFKLRGEIPSNLLKKKARLMIFIDDKKNSGTKGTVNVTYGGRIVGKKKGLKLGDYRTIDLPPIFWGNDENIELKITISGRDDVAIRTQGAGSPARLVISN